MEPKALKPEIKSRQKSRQVSDLYDHKPLTLEDYLAKPDIEKALPNESEERLIMGPGSKDSPRSSPGVKERKKKTSQIVEKLVLEDKNNIYKEDNLDTGPIRVDYDTKPDIYNENNKTNDQYNFKVPEEIEKNIPDNLTSHLESFINDELKDTNENYLTDEKIKKKDSLDNLFSVKYENKGLNERYENLHLGSSSKFIREVNVSREKKLLNNESNKLDTVYGNSDENEDKKYNSQILFIDQVTQTTPIDANQVYTNESNRLDDTISAQSLEIQSLNNKLKEKDNQMHILTLSNLKSLKKLEKYQKKIEKLTQENKKLLALSNEKDEIIETLKTKPQSPTKKSQVQQKSNLLDNEFWKVDSPQESNKKDPVSLQEISKNMSLWINHIEEKAPSISIKQKSPSISKKPILKESQIFQSKNNFPRKSLEPLTPLNRRKSSKDA
jgi:hypothetical protein